jgi:hypothetical protein
MIDGKSISIGGKQYMVPPMNFKTLKKVLPMIKSWGSDDFKSKAEAGDAEYVVSLMSKFSDVILLSLQRNYPDLTLDQLEEDLTFNDFSKAIDIIIEVSGLVKVGEKKPVQEPTPQSSSGETSMDISSPLPDTLTVK